MTTDIDGKADIYLTDGHVHILGMNPTTGETKETDVDPGTKVTVYLYNDRAVDSVMFEPEEFTVDELPFEVIKKISKDKNDECIWNCLTISMWRFLISQCMEFLNESRVH